MERRPDRQGKGDDIRVEESSSLIEVHAANYVLSYRPGSDFLTVKVGSLIQEILIPSSCDSDRGFDLNRPQESFAYRSDGDSVHMEFHYSSSLWKKTYFVLARMDRVEYSYELTGHGKITDLHFFEGIWESGFEEDCYLTKHFCDRGRTPYRQYRAGSRVAFEQVFNPEPNSYNKQLFESFEDSLIGVNCDLDYCGGNFVANPGILCFALGLREAEWIGCGLVADPGQYLFSEMAYAGGREFGFCVSYWAAMNVEGIFRTPSVWMIPATSALEAVEGYVEGLRADNLVPRNSAFPKHAWWRKPMVCGWGFQSNLGDLFRVRSNRPRDTAVYDACTQENYAELVDILDRHELPWHTLTIDARWFLEDALLTPDPSKWPDLRGFVDELHARGRRVLIWWGPWNIGGFERQELITFSEPTSGRLFNRPGRFAKFGGIREGAPIAPDVTLGSVQDKLRDRIGRLLGSGVGCYDLDGIKIDHVASTPALYGLNFPPQSDSICGIELLRRYYDFIYASSKSVKSDCLIIGQSPNPYFAGSFDMLRLGDIYSRRSRSVLKEMAFRRKMALVAGPEWEIDCDGWPFPSIEAMREYLMAQPALGVPSLYYGDELDTTGEQIPADLFEELGSLWEVSDHRSTTAQLSHDEVELDF